MKVTVCFGPVSVVVPCGNGDILVRDLISQAVTRYRKAANKSTDVSVAVGALRSSDGAILDPDDRLMDVVDDREQLVACLSDAECHPASELRIGLGLRGDGTSASSNSGSPSPDFLHRTSRKDIEVTGEFADSGDLLQVRRGSEPALNHLNPAAHPNENIPRDYKRWSAAPIVEVQSDSDSEEKKVVRRHPSGPRFARSGARVSMQIFGGGHSTGYRWAEAADNALLSSAVTTPTSPTPPDYEETIRRTRSMRREPVGATSDSSSSALMDGGCTSILLVLPNEGGPLGIHVVPDYSPLGSEMGLLVQGVEAGGRIHRDGRISVGDRIVEINSHPLKDVVFHRAQELFRNALQSRDLRLRIVKAVCFGPPLSSSSSNCMTSTPIEENRTIVDNPSSRGNPNGGIITVPADEPHLAVARVVAAVSPTRKPPTIPGTRASALMTISTRKIGKKLDIELTKGQAGLGFSVTTRDNPAGGGLCPIYIKNILPKGAAIEDGRLKSGDRLLEVNGEEMTGKNQNEVVTILRTIPSGGTARLLISRQEVTEDETSPKLPRQMKSMNRASEESLLLPWKQREILTLDIPVHDTEKAGLGISVKGKTTTTSSNATTDLGIFIKSVLHGGAASRDGRLCTNDQLLHVNGVSLLGRSNTEAMEGLRRAVHQEGPTAGHITLTIARKVRQSIKDREGEGQSDDANGTIRIGAGAPGDNSSTCDHSGGSSDQSGSTVIFVSGGSECRERSSKEQLSALSDLRNESYFRATHETWNTTQLQETLSKSTANNNNNNNQQTSPTVHNPPGEVVSIDGDYVPQSRPPRCMFVGNNGSLSTTPDIPSPSVAWNRARAGPADGRDRWPEMHSPSAKDSGHVTEKDRPSDSEAPSYTSQTSLEDPNAPGFSRDQFGRQSMSEKRHASLDAKHTDTYQRNKKLREEREKQQKQNYQETEQSAKENVPPPSSAVRGGSTSTVDSRGSRLTVVPIQSRISSVESLPPSAFLPKSVGSEAICSLKMRLSSRDIGPTLGLKKSSSLESLQTVVHEIQMQEEEPQIGCYGYRPNGVRVVRGRGCNESFRAAVDRSYESNDNKEHMETLDEECGETVEMSPPAPICGADTDEPHLDNKCEMRKSKKKPGHLLLRGLGSMFRFGRHRKSPSSPEPPATTTDAITSAALAANHERRPSVPHGTSTGTRSDVDRHHVLRRTLPPDERDRAELGRQMAMAVARQAAQEEQKRIQHHYVRLMDQQQKQQQQQQIHQQQQQQQQQIHQQKQQQQQQSTGHAAQNKSYNQHSQSIPQQNQADANQNSGDPANRSQRLHQLRAQHQQRQPHRQSMYAPSEQQFEGNNGLAVAHGRSSSYDPYNDVRKPRSRTAVGEPNTFVPMVSSKSAAYTDDSQFHLNRRQQHYHSQRSSRETRMSPPGNNHWPGSDRPVSNYFEYESLHIAGHTVALNGPPYKPQQVQYQGNRRLPTVAVGSAEDGGPFLRRVDRATGGHSNDYGTQGRLPQRESVYGAPSYGNNNRPAPLAGSKV